MTPEFDPTTFLSTLNNRHQTLEDLRAELSTRSQDLNKELLDLVNENYQGFLSLGSSLKGGDEKVEEVRLGLFGFRREVEGLRAKVDRRSKEVEELLEEKKRIRESVQIARGLLEVDRKIGDLEMRLMLNSGGMSKVDESGRGGELSDSEAESDEEESANGITVPRLRRHTEQFLQIKRLIHKIGPEHPFLESQEERIVRLNQTILLDLNSALKQAIISGNDMTDDLLKILGIYTEMDAVNEAIKVLKESKERKA